MSELKDIDLFVLYFLLSIRGKRMYLCFNETFNIEKIFISFNKGKSIRGQHRVIGNIPAQSHTKISCQITPEPLNAIYVYLLKLKCQHSDTLEK